jgi:branched-chain amino acid transport system substrate-binding protein
MTRITAPLPTISLAVLASLASGPAGKTAIDPKTHHCSLDVYIAEAQNRAFKVVQSDPQQPPADTAAVSDLKKNPGEDQQYVVDVKT